ncbi:EndoU domain-containing protein [Micromonospora phytophila]|uniref:EndoU domain-containing protein n=1 Tax=Micromonospora phytophila TaxID=709888 RepID=UPI00202FEC3C|nr:EndoU domain-containing protein [Micromonospora phytophila]MCM0675754.1 EndoU domain-containing protein [Micromonospora phytophila]
MRAALRFLRKTKGRNRPGRMNPHFVDHVFGGHVKPGQAKGSGYHYRPGGQDFPGRRIRPGTVERDATTGAYTAEPEFFDPTLDPPNGAWKPKAGNQGMSTFFPDDWTPAQVDNAIPGAFENAVRVPGTNKWRGTYRGVTIEGFYNSSGGFTHGWPVVSHSGGGPS